MITVRLSGELRKLIDGKEEVKFVVGDIEGCINILEQQYPGVRKQFIDEKEEVRDEINIYVNGDNIRALEGLSTPLKEGDEVDFMSAFAAG